MRGKNKYEDTLTGFNTYFNSCTTDKIIDYIEIGAAIATIGAVIAAAIYPPSSLVTGIAGGLIAAGISALNVAASNGYGIKVKWFCDNYKNFIGLVHNVRYSIGGELFY